MKLGLKIILPILIILTIILGTFGYLFYDLKQQEAVVSAQTVKIQKLISLDEQLGNQQEQTDYNVLSYRFSQDKSFLLLISQAELDKSKTLDEIYPLITTSRGRELVASYINTRKEVESLRNGLIKAIDLGDKEQISLNYNKWSIQTQNIKAAFSDIKAYNINALEQILFSIGALRKQIFQIIIAIALLITILIIFLYFYLREIVTQPIIQLAKLANRVSQGEFVTIAENTSTDEIGQLSKNFNFMVQSLQKVSEEEKKMDQAKDEFVSLAAHQLRTPLGIIRWSIEALLKKKTIAISVREQLASILESDMGLIGSVNDILCVTRINQGKIECKAQMTVLAKEIEAIILKLTPLAENQSVGLKLISKDNSSKVEVDPKLFSEVLNNVLSNAIKYSKKNGTVTISLKDTKDTLEIKVVDDGIGIPQEDVERVFQKFSRARNAGKSGAEGTGLGLFIAQQYLFAMKGTIRLESTEGKGTTVYITLKKHLTGDN